MTRPDAFAGKPDAWRHDRGMWIAIAVALLLWAWAFAGIRAGLQSYGPGELALLRFGTASVALLLYALVARMRLPSVQDLPVIFAAGLLGITTYHLALNIGEQTVTAGAAALLISTSPIFTAVLSMLLLKERFTIWGWTGLGVSAGGVAMIALGGEGGIALDPNALVILVAAAATALYFVVAKRPLQRYSALEFTTYAIWAGTLPLLVFAPGLISQLPLASGQATWSGIFLGIFPGAIAYVLWNRALSVMPASLLSTFLYFQPINAVWIAWLWLGEVPSALALLGGAISLVGVVVVAMRGVNGKETRLT